MQYFTNKFVSYAFLGLSIICVAVTLPTSFTTIPNNNIKHTKKNPIFSISKDSDFNLNRFEALVNETRTKLDIALKFPKNSTIVPEKFNNILSKAVEKGVNVRLLLVERSYKPPTGVHYKYFTFSKYKFNVNFAILDDEKFFMPTSFFHAETENAISFNVYFSNSTAVATSSRELFEYLWDMPENRLHYVVKNEWANLPSLGNDVKLVWAPANEFPLIRTTFSGVLKDVFDESADDKIIVSESFLRHKKDYKSNLQWLGIMSEIEKMDSPDKIRFVTDQTEYKTYSNETRMLLVSRLFDPNAARLQKCRIPIDGTLISVTDEFLLFPGGYDDLTDDALIFGISFVTTQYHPNIERFFLNLTGTHCPNLQKATLS